jgi:hypothetical protein
MQGNTELTEEWIQKLELTEQIEPASTNISTG